MHSQKLPALIPRLKKKFVRLDRTISKHPVLAMVATLALCALIIVLRKPGAFTHAQFWAEDGSLWFGQAYNNSYGAWQTITQSYSGTFDVANRLVGYAATFVPMAYAPLLFNVAALAAQLLPVFIINSSRLKPVVRYRLVAIVVSLMYVCVANSAEVFVNLTNMQWHLGVAAFLILIAGKPTSRLWVAFDIAVLGLTGITGPLGLALVIIAFLIWYRTRTSAALTHVSVLVLTSLYQVSSLLIIQPGQRGGHTAMSAANLAKMISGQIFTGGILGERYVGYFYNSFLVYAVLAAGLLIIVYAIRQAPSWLAYANLYSLLVFIFMLGSLKPIAGGGLWRLMTQPGAGERYWYIPILVWLMTLLWVALVAKNLAMRAVCACLLLLFIGIGIPGSWTIPPRPDQHYRYYVSKFNALPSGQHFKIPINPTGWYINLQKH